MTKTLCFAKAEIHHYIIQLLVVGLTINSLTSAQCGN